MRVHRTKNKGDLGVMAAQLDLARRGFDLLLPLTEHQAFDLVAYKDARFYRVQVKYRALVKGVITLPFSTSWADRHGSHTRKMDKREVDLVCIYCPDTDCCYYLDPRKHGEHVSLRVASVRGGQTRRIRWAETYRNLPPEVEGVPATSTHALESAPWLRQSSWPSKTADGGVSWAPVA